MTHSQTTKNNLKGTFVFESFPLLNSACAFSVGSRSSRDFTFLLITSHLDVDTAVLLAQVLGFLHSIDIITFDGVWTLIP